MRLIDADAIRVKPEYMENVCGIATIRAEDLARILNEQPTIPYTLEPQLKKLKVPEKCGKCRSCSVAITGSPYCRMEAASSVNSQMDISTIYVNVDSRPVWCPIIKMNDELDRMPFEKRAEFEKLRTWLSSWLGGEDL